MLPQRRSGWHLLDLRLKQPGTFIGGAAGAIEPMMVLVGGWGQERVRLLRKRRARLSGRRCRRAGRLVMMMMTGCLQVKRRGVAIHYWLTLPVATAVSSVSLVPIEREMKRKAC